MDNKICFIVPYYGKLPVYFSLFINSVKDKPFDVLFFTDIARPEALPDNVTWNIMPFEGLYQLFKSKLNLPISLIRPYKLCDYKVAYGVLFPDYLSTYSFWGSIDVDTVVGDFGKFITDELLNRIDVYSGVKEYLSGSFFLIRNSPRCNELFKKSRDWVKVLTNDKSYAFDECGGHYHAELKSGISIFDIHTEIQSFTEVILLEMKNGLRVFFSDQILEPGGFNYVIIKKTGIWYFERDYPIVHLIYFKSKNHFDINPLVNTPQYYLSGWGNFKKKPIFLNLLFLKSVIVSIFKKIRRAI